MNYQITGALYSGTATEQKTDKFKVRKFVLKVTENVNGSTYENFVEFQLVNNNCDILDRFQKGQPVTVHFNVRGNLWVNANNEAKCITNLNAWKIEPAQAQQPAQPQQPAQQQWGRPAAPAQQQAPGGWGQPQQQQQSSGWGQPQSPPQQPAQPSWGGNDDDKVPF